MTGDITEDVRSKNIAVRQRYLFVMLSSKYVTGGEAPQMYAPDAETDVLP